MPAGRIAVRQTQGGGTVADKSSQMVLSALSRAAADPGGLPLHGSKASPGLFPSTAAGKAAARRAADDGMLSLLPLDDTTAGGRRDVWAITDKGLSFLLSQTSPREVLEDFVRALEARQSQAADLADAVRQMTAGLEAMRAHVDRVLPEVMRVAARPLAEQFRAFQAAALPPLEERLLAHLDAWQGTGSAEDCPLPELFRRLSGEQPDLTLGAFHDALRRLHDGARLWLHPWPGPLYDLPEPPFALLVGHQVAYYASCRR
jgi:hypothetical protein